MNLSNSQTGSSSCQCPLTLHGQKKETKKDVNTIHRQLQIMLANSLAVIGLSWGADHKRNGSEPTLTNPTDHEIKLHRNDGKFLRIGSSNISCLQEVNTLQWY